MTKTQAYQIGLKFRQAPESWPVYYGFDGVSDLRCPPKITGIPKFIDAYCAGVVTAICIEYDVSSDELYEVIKYRSVEVRRMVVNGYRGWYKQTHKKEFAIHFC
jgi:hypothetical protein